LAQGARCQLLDCRMPRTTNARPALPAPGQHGTHSSGCMAIAKLPPSKEARVRAASQPSKVTQSFLDKHCKSHVSEEWKNLDDRKIAKLRGILAALQEENQSTQLLKRLSEDAEAKRALEETRGNVDTRLAACKKKEEFFLRKQQELRGNVQANEKSLLELESTIDKGEKKAKDEQAECRRLDQEIMALESDVSKQLELKATEEKKIAKTAEYRKSLESVVLEQDEYDDIETLMNRYNTLEAGHRELFQSNSDLTSRLDREREECLKEQAVLQNKHLVMSSQLHECQMNLDHHRVQSQEMEQRLNRALEEKELKESQVGVIQMAIEQLFQRTLASCRLKQRRQMMVSSIDTKFAPIRGDKSDVQLEAMLNQIVERMEDLASMLAEAQEEMGETNVKVAAVVEEGDLRDKVYFASPGGDKRQETRQDASTSADNSDQLSSNTRSMRMGGGADAGMASGPDSPDPRSNLFLTADSDI